VAELELSRGLACRRAGLPGVREAFYRAAELGRKAADPTLLARVGVGWSRGYFSEVGTVDAEFVTVLRDALREPALLPVPLRAMAMIALAAELTWAPEADDRFALADEALELARAGADRAALAQVLAARHLTVMAADTLAVRRRDAAELLALATEQWDLGLRFPALFHRTGPAIEDGEVGLVERLLGDAGHIADQLRQPSLQWNVDWSRASLLLWQGELAAAEKLATESAERGIAAGHQREATLFLSGQLVELRRLQGRLAEVVPLLIAVPPHPSRGLSVARYLCAAGERDAAAAHLSSVRLIGGRLALRRDPLERPSLDDLACLAVELGRRDLADAVYRRLLPLADTFGHGVVAHPIGHHWLGVLALELGRPADAAGHLRRAVQRQAELGLPLACAESELALARAYHWLDDPARAAAARANAVDIATGRGAAGLVTEAAREERQP
jgi:tetratricopeptide (TPR) repeat protein